MPYQGVDPEGLRRLRDEVALAGRELGATRREVEAALAGPCVASTVPGELREIEAWLAEEVADLDRRLAELERERERWVAKTGFPPHAVGDCHLMAEGIGGAVDVVVKRLRDLRADVHNLRVLKPRGETSFQGHIEQLKGRQRQLGKQLTTWDGHRCPEEPLAVAVAREYVRLDVRAELGWPPPGAQASAADRRHDRWWEVDWSRAGRATATGVAVVVAGAAAVARAANPLSWVLGP